MKTVPAKINNNQQTNQHNAFLGTGWSFPPRFLSGNQQVLLSQDAEDIQQSLKILLSTSPGERIMNPQFGCRIHRFIFEEITQTTLTEMEFEITQAMLLFESRINLQSIQIVPSPEKNVLIINVEYHIVTTNTRDNMVYPFFLQEGTLISPELRPISGTSGE